MADLFDVLGRNWIKNKDMVGLLNEMFNEFKELEFEFIGDDEKRLLSEEIQEAAAMVLRYVLKYYNRDWIKHEMINKFIDQIFKALKIVHSKKRNDGMCEFLDALQRSKKLKKIK